jgi:vitamin B12 transporter
MGRPGFVLFLALFFAVLPSLHSQDAEPTEDDFYDDLPLMEDQGVTVVGTAETTQPMTVISRETIQDAHAPDIPALLEQTLGLGTTRYGPYGSMADVNIRGFDTERVAVLIDGIPVNSTRSGEFDFYRLDVNAIERIELIYGGSDTKYNVSGALGGVINIVTVQKQKPGWTLDASFANSSYLPGSYDKYNAGGVGSPQWQDLGDTQKLGLSALYGADRYSLRMNLFGNRAGNHFLYQDNYGAPRRKEGNEVWDTGASVSFLRELSGYTKLIATGDIYYGDKRIPASGYTAEYAEQNDFSTRQTIRLDMPRAFHDDFSMELSLGHNWSLLDYDPGNDPSRHDEHDLTLINRWDWYPLTTFTLRFGGDYRFIYLDSTNDGIRDGHRGGLYLTSEYAPSGKWLLIGSVKGAADGESLIPVPKLGFAWQINGSLTLKNNYYRSFKFPDFDDLYWIQEGFMGNPDLKPEDGWGADLSVEFRRAELLTLDSSFYWEWTKNSIHWNNASGDWRPENISRGAFLGWDNRLNVTLPFSPGPLEKPVVSLFWQFQLSWLLNGTNSFADAVRIPYMPMHILSLALELPWKTRKGLPGSVVVSGRFESSRFADTANLIVLDPYVVLNLTYNQRVRKNLAVFGTVNNALNTRYVSFNEYPMPGISITLGMRVNFELNREKPND